MSKKISRRNRRIRNLLLVISMMMVVAMASVGVTVAWLTASTETIENTFTAGNINITLTETVDEDKDGKHSFKMLPGNDIKKDPLVTVLANSEDCYLFVKLEKFGASSVTDADGTITSYGFDAFLTYNMAANWTELQGVSGVYWRAVDADAADQSFGVLAGDKVTVNNTVTKAMMDGITTNPLLKVTAYACQRDTNITTAADAWTVVNTGNLPNSTNP